MDRFHSIITVILNNYSYPLNTLTIEILESLYNDFNTVNIATPLFVERNTKIVEVVGIILRDLCNSFIAIRTNPSSRQDNIARAFAHSLAISIERQYRARGGV